MSEAVMDARRWLLSDGGHNRTTIVGAIMSDLVDEIELLRAAIRRLADEDATLAVGGGNVLVEMDATLTDAEREAVEAACNFFCHECETDGATDDDYQHAATLRGLLERTGVERE